MEFKPVHSSEFGSKFTLGCKTLPPACVTTFIIDDCKLLPKQITPLAEVQVHVIFAEKNKWYATIENVES